MAAAAASRAAFGEPGAPFTPHLSLLYSELPESDRLAFHLNGLPLLRCLLAGSRDERKLAGIPSRDLVMPWLVSALADSLDLIYTDTDHPNQ